MANYGLKVSTPGTAVETQIEKDVLFSTKYNTLKINSQGFSTVSTNGSGNGTTTVAHNLGYAPAFIAFQKCTASFPFLGTQTYASAYVPDPGVYNIWGGTAHAQVSTYSDGTNITFLASSAQASSTYVYKYYTFVDLAADYSGTANPSLSSNWGWKVSKPGVSVLTAKEYQLQYSTRYKSLQYYKVNYGTQNLTLPNMFASVIDSTPQEATYVDFEHGLNYPPLFLAFFQGTAISGGTQSTIIPYTGVNNADVPDYGVWAFSDNTRVRISFWRKATLLGNTPNENWSTETIKIQCYIFTEDLSQ